MSKKPPTPAETEGDGAAMARLGLALPFPQKSSIKQYADRLRGLEVDGGIISGPGTATSDSIPAAIRETGEPIKVSNRERIVSADQDAFLNTIAQGAGYKSLDAMFADFGMPAGPTVKGGKRAAADGMAPEDDQRTAAAIQAPPSLGATPIARSEPAGGALSGPAGGIIGNPFGPKSSTLGSGIFQIDSNLAPDASSQSQQPAKPGRDASGIITADSAKAAMGNDMQRSGGIFGTIDMAGANAILARENKARGEMIDLSIKANGGNGIAALPENSADAQWNAAFDQRRMVEGMQDAMRKAGTKTERAAIGQAMNTMLNNQVQQRGQDLNYAASMAQQGLTARGQDLNNAQQIAANGLTMRGQDLTSQNHQEGNRLSAVRAGLDMERFGLEKQAAQRLQSASDGLAQATASGDQGAIARARQAAASAGLKVEPLQHVETDRGLMTFDPRTGQMTPATGTDGAPVGGGKPLTEFQGKATGFGMRAHEASQIIERIGQGGKVQPSLIKRGAESVPLIGEGLGMMANKLQSPEQQQVEQAQRDFVNAVLRQESGAAISASEFDNARKQYFPQPGDTPEVIAQKQASREAEINGFRVSAGPGAKHIGAPAQAPAQQPTQAQQQPAAGPKVGHVDGKHVFIGGNPADPASWVEVR